MLYNISHSQQWSELQRFLVPKLTQLRALCQTQSIQKPGTGAGTAGLGVKAMVDVKQQGCSMCYTG